MGGKMAIIVPTKIGGLFFMAKIRDDPYQEVYNHFLVIYPKLKNKVIGYRPYGFMTILLYFSDG